MGKTTVDSQTSGDFHPGMEQRYGGGGGGLESAGGDTGKLLMMI